MSGLEIIAERLLETEFPGRPRQSARIAIAKPQERADGAFGCPVFGEGFDNEETPFEVVGVDSLQAISLALTYLRARLNRFQKLGGSVYFPGETDAIAPDQSVL